MLGELITTADTYDAGRRAINNAFSAQTSFNILSASTIFSGSTDLSELLTGGSSSSTAITKSFQTLTMGIFGNINWDYLNGYNATVTLSGDATLNISNADDGDYGTLQVIQDSTGGRQLTLPTSSKLVNGGGTLILSEDANAEDMLTFVKIGSTFYWNIGYDYQ